MGRGGLLPSWDLETKRSCERAGVVAPRWVSHFLVSPQRAALGGPPFHLAPIMAALILGALSTF